MDHSLGPDEQLQRLAEVGQVCNRTETVVASVVAPIDIEDLVSPLPEVGDNPAASLSAAACHYDSHR
jgi:hypothetical protein